MSDRGEQAPLAVAVLGATGRMGRTLIRLIARDERFRLAGAATEAGHAALGEDAGLAAGVGATGVTLGSDPGAALADASVAIDFTLPAATLVNAAAAVAAATPIVIGTTGLSDADFTELRAAARRLAIVYGRNMSVGVNLATELTRLASRALGDGYDAEISETHHRDKIDAPSGTALQLGEAVAAGRGTRLDAVARYDRHGADAARRPGDIGFAALRAGRVVGDHTVMFGGDEEIIEIRHRALDRAAFARGALRAAAWVVGREPGWYTMHDVLEL